MKTSDYQKYGTADSSKIESFHCLQAYIVKMEIYEVFTHKDMSGNWDEQIYIKGRDGAVYLSAQNGGPYWNERLETGEYPDFSKMYKLNEDEYLQLKN